MPSILKLFFKIFIIPFYILNAGFFLLSFIVIFGIIHPPQLIYIHVSLVQGIINSDIVTWIVLLIWMIYNLKCVLFCLRIIKREEDTIFFNLQALTAFKQWMLLFVSHCTLYLPVIIYSCFVVYMAYQKGYLYYCAGLVLFQLVMCMSAVYIYYFSINFTWRYQSFNTLFLPAFNLFRGKLRIPLYLLYYTFHYRKIIFFVTKIASIFLLNIILGTEKEYFTMRDFIFVFMIIVVIHALLIYYYVELIEKMMSFSRNMPVPRMHRFLLFLITYLLVLIPELLFILINGYGMITFYTTIAFYSIAVAQLLLYTSILYVKSMRMKPYLQIVFCVYLVSSMWMLSGNYDVIGLVNLILAVIFFYRNYYHYEVEIA
jgi:hypothetical protein